MRYFLVGKLTCAVARSLVNDIGRLDFGITRFRCLIEEELNQCTLQLGSLAYIDRESGTGDFNT